MKVRNLFFGAAFCAATVMWNSSVYSQAKDEKKPAAEKPAAAQPAKPGDKAAGQPSEADMAKMIAAGKPGPEHAKLDSLVGKWNFVTKYRMSPEQPWQESPGKAEYRWGLGKRILYHEVKANPSPQDAMMGGPFEGFGMTGYDNMTKKYYNVWADNMGTGIMSSTGSADSSGKTFTYGSDEYTCPMTGEKKKTKSVLKIAGDDKVVYEMYDKDPDGKEFMTLEVTYTRQK